MSSKHSSQAVVEHRDYHDNELAERQDRAALFAWDPATSGAHELVDAMMEGEDEGMEDQHGAGAGDDVDGLAAAEQDLFGGEADENEEGGYQDDGEGAEQGGLGHYQ